MPQPSTQKEEEEESKEDREEGVPALPHVAWAEFGLAVVGYYFFSLVLLHQSINFQVN